MHLASSHGSDLARCRSRKLASAGGREDKSLPPGAKRALLPYWGNIFGGLHLGAELRGCTYPRRIQISITLRKSGIPKIELALPANNYSAIIGTYARMSPTFDKCHSNHHYLESAYDQRDEPHIRCMHKALIQSVALVFEIEERELETATRGKAPIALARQVAMYIARIGWCLTLTEVGRLFGRDRTTVAHACEAIEDLRDDPSFDRRLELLEKGLNALTAARSLPSRCQAGDAHAHAHE